MSKWLYLNILHLCNDGFKIGMVTLLPFLAHDLHLNFTTIGILGSSSNIVQILVGFPAAVLVTKIGGLKMLTIGLFFYCFGYLATSFSYNFSTLFVCFLIAGVGFAIFHPVAIALLSRWADPARRGKILGNFTATGDIGTAIFPASIPFLVTTYGWRFTSFLYTIIILLIGIISLLLKPQDEKLSKKKKISKPFHHLLKTSAFLAAHVAVITDSFASSTLIIFLPFLLLRHGFTTTHLGIAIAVFFLGSLAGKTLLGTFTDTLGSYKVFIFAEITMALAIVLLLFTYSLAFMLIIIAFLGALTKGTAPVGVTMVSEAVQSHGDFEKAFGFNSVITALALSIAPIFLGHLSDRYGIATAFLAMAFFALLATLPAFVFGKVEK